MARREWRISDAVVLGGALLLALLVLGPGQEVVVALSAALAASGLIALLHRARRSNKERALIQSLAVELDAPADWVTLLGLIRKNHKAAGRLGPFRSAAEQALQDLREGVFFYRPEKGVTYANPAARSIFSFREEPAFRLAGNPGMARILEMIRLALSSGEVQSSEFELSFPESRLLVAKAIPSEGGEWAVVIVEDVTEERRVRATRRDFVASAAHELRTPAATILGLTETLSMMGDEDPEQSTRFQRLLRKEAGRLSRLVGDLLDLSRLERPDVAATFGPVPVDEILASIRDPLENLAQASGIQFEMRWSEQLPPIWGEPELVRLIGMNLMENAIRYNREGGWVRVRVHASSHDGHVVLTVEDNGAGIPSKELPRIFERFYRVDRSGSRESGSTGLGLSIVKHAAELLKGSVEVESTLGEGSVFTVRFPKSEAPASPRVPSQIPESHPSL